MFHFLAARLYIFILFLYIFPVGSARRPSILPVPDRIPESAASPGESKSMGNNIMETLAISDGGATSDEAEDDVPWIGPAEEISQVIKGFPPVSPYIGVTPTLCYLLREKKQLCCLQLAQVSMH